MQISKCYEGENIGFALSKVLIRTEDLETLSESRHKMAGI